MEFPIIKSMFPELAVCVCVAPDKQNPGCFQWHSRGFLQNQCSSSKLKLIKPSLTPPLDSTQYSHHLFISHPT